MRAAYAICALLVLVSGILAVFAPQSRQTEVWVIAATLAIAASFGAAVISLRYRAILLFSRILIWADNRPPRLLGALVCPITKETLDYEHERHALFSRGAGLAYPIHRGVPILLPVLARPLDEKPTIFELIVRRASVAVRLLRSRLAYKMFLVRVWADKTPVNSRLLEVLVCPITKEPPHYDRDRNELVSYGAGLAYPIHYGIPIMLPEDARQLGQRLTVFEFIVRKVIRLTDRRRERGYC